MRKTMKILLWLGGVLLALPILAIALVFVALNTQPGRTLAETQIAHLTGNTVLARGLSGRFPDHLRLAHLELRDPQGPWLQADAVALDWSPLALLHRQALIHRLEAASLQLPRLPASSLAPAQPSAEPSKPFTLPVRVTIDSLILPQAELGAPITGTPATLALQGRADLPTLETGTATIQAARKDAEGAYALNAEVTGTTIAAHLDITEPDTGLLAQLAKLPAIGPLHLQATIAGPRAALATTVGLTAGPLTADAHGTVDLDHGAAALDLTANAPAMHPAPDIAWRAVTLQAHLAGPFTTPDATGRLQIHDLQAAGATLQTLDATITGNAGQVSLDALATALRLPTPNSALLAAAPLHLTATARLDDPARPVRYTLTHPLITIDGTAQTAQPLTADATLTLPDLAPFAAIANTAAAGHTTLTLHAAQSATATTVTAEGTLGLTAGPAPAPALIGPAAKFSIAAQLAGPAVTITRATIDGAALHLDAAGTRSPAALDVTATVATPNLALIAPTLTGDALLKAHVQGPSDALALTATLTGNVGAPGLPRAPLTLTADLTGLPAAPTGHITAEGTLAQAPLHLAVNATKDPAGTLHATIEKADWRSLHAEGALTLPPGQTLPEGRVALRFQNLADLRPLLAQPLAGALTATLTLDPTAATLEAEAHNAGLPGTAVAHATLHAHAASLAGHPLLDPQAHPTLTASLTADGIAAPSTTGSAHLELTGPQDALALRTTANLILSGTPAQIAATALLDTPAKQLRLQTLQIDARPPVLPTTETLRLLTPATIRFADAITVDHLRLGLRQAVLDVAGRLSPTLDATATLRTPADIASIASPTLALDGAIALDAKLTGPSAHPSGTVKLTATAVRSRTGPGRALPPANLTATAQLAGAAARIDARLTAGTANLALAGQAPLSQGPLALTATGALDLTLLDPILTPAGRRARGRLTLDTTIAGSLAAPRLSGTAQLANGELQDFAQGVHLTNLAATIRADNDTVRIASFTGRAGPGTIAATGTIGALAPGLPVDLTITLRNARPLASDLVTADLDADLTLKGPATPPPGATPLQAAGHILIRHAELNIPNNLPANVAVLDVRRPGDKPRPKPAPRTVIALDLAIDAPGQIFLRGRGIDAEMSGALHVRGLSTEPQVAGSLDMRRGAVSLAGTTLTFSRGKIGFDGTGISGKIDPTLDFAAESTAASVTATLAITGYVSKPKITLTSVPDLPQDEVLAQLLFKRSAKDLGPFQIAQIAAGLAQLSGVGGGASFSPLETIRKSLGLDRLGVGSSSDGVAGAPPPTTTTQSTPTVEAGRYVANGVYVGAKQGTTGNQTQATVQIDITKGLKLETDVGSGEGGNQVGVTYQYEY